MSAKPTEQDIRIVLIGKTGVGKSATGNTVLGSDVFHKAASFKSVTQQCTLGTTVFNGKRITVVDTPGWCDTGLTDAELTKEIVKCIKMSSPGPHVFLLLFAIGNRFTTEERKSMQKIQEIFGEGATRYTMILFTKGDNLDGATFHDYLEGATEDLKALIDKCGGRCQVFDNRDKSSSQVTKLLENIQDMVHRNGGECYTNAMYQLVENCKKREARLQLEADTARREKEAIENELHRLRKVMDEERQMFNIIVAMQQQLEIAENTRRQEGERIQIALSAQSAEHRRMMDLETQKQKEEQQKHQRQMEILETNRQIKEAQHRHRMETERMMLEKEVQDLSKRFEATNHKLEEQKTLTRAEMEKMEKEIRKRKSCVMS